MITSNVIQRVFYIRVGKSTGTAFTLDHEGRRYLVSAAHVCSSLVSGSIIEIFHDRAWKPIHIEIVGFGDPADMGNDVYVMSLPEALSPSHPLPASGAELYFGQDVYFLGFPYGLFSDFRNGVNAGFPIPFIKKGIFSGSISSPSGFEINLLDGHNNPGFSGGPVVFTPTNDPTDFRVFGLISGFQTENINITKSGKATNLYSPANTGIIVCPSITRVIDIIVQNPIGFNLIP